MPRPSALATSLLTLAAPAQAQRLSYEAVGEDEAPAFSSTQPARKESGEADKHPWLQYALLDRFEWSPVSGADTYAWDFSALLGGEKNRVYIASSGDGAFSGRLEYAELDALYSRYVGSDWDLNFGLRYDLRPRPNRLYVAAGGQYDNDKLWLGAWTYLSTHGEVSARLAGYYNLKLIGPLVLQPSWELDANAQDVPALGLGRGLSYAELGLRLRYEIRPWFAPYVGLSWARDLGRTARMTRTAGDDPETKNVVMGLRSEF